MKDQLIHMSWCTIIKETNKLTLSKSSMKTLENHSFLTNIYILIYTVLPTLHTLSTGGMQGIEITEQFICQTYVEGKYLN